MFMTTLSPRHRRGEPPAIQIRPSNEVPKSHVCQGLTRKLGSTNRTLVVERDVSDLIARHIRPNIRDGRPPSDERWEFCALIAEWRGQDPLAIAELYQNAAWCAKAQDREQHIRRRVAAWLEHVLETGTPNRSIVLYLIGEQYRRCGDKSVADTWFDAAVAEADPDPATAQLKELALQQKVAPRDLMS